MPKNILIVGFGTAGQSLAKSLQANGQKVQGFLDDVLKDKAVLGTLADVNTIVKTYGITDIYFAIPSASAQVVRTFLARLTHDDVTLSIIPRSFNIIAKNTVSLHDLTDVDILALIGREPVKHDLLACREFVKGKTVAVTGAAGSIGSKLVKLLVDLQPDKIVCIDWWENGIFYLQQEFLDQKNMIFKIADIKNAQRMDAIFDRYKPDIVLHAAAYKHVPLMQQNAVEAFNNNVWGSLNVMEQAIKHNVKNFVYVSTDKAVRPANVMGTTKRLGEMLLETLAASQNGTKFNAVRFGNVIQSNGSVIHTFKKQIQKSEPVTVTHKDVTRFFMTVEEAAQLIVQSAALGKNGEIFVLDMGEQIKIIDLAKSLIRLAKKDNPIKIIGLRPGDKLYEELSYDPQNVGKTTSNKVFIVKDEKPFDHQSFHDAIRALLDRSLRYDLSSSDMKNELTNMGFNAQD
ncbi:MAG TPA: polysaccharide biosynthesis protein [Candidatus Saccharimonas sp.]|nr:polysaccharide biosynthesis protein [Candidatus Saccharimonas sp.]